MDVLKSMRLFLRCVDDGSITAAARNSGMSNAAVSRNISALENYLGSQLLNRGRKLTLTEAGEDFCSRVRPLLDALQETTDSISAEGGGVRGILRVHTRFSIGELIVGPALPRFFSRYPEVTVELTTSNTNAVDMLHRNIDLDLRVDRHRDSSLVARRLGPNRNLLVASPEYLERHGRPRTPHDLERHDFVVYHIAGEHTPLKFRDEAGTVTAYGVHERLRTDNGMILKAAVKQGIGLGLIPAWMITTELRDRELIGVLDDYKITRSSFDVGLYAVFQRSRVHSARIRAFVEVLREVVAEAS